MNDSEISLAVAKVMYPQLEWKASTIAAYYTVKDIVNCNTFDYTTDDALGKMVVWLAWCDDLCTSDMDVILYSGDPHKEIAMAILEVSCAD